MDAFMQAAIDEEARQRLSEGGIPIGSVLVHEERLLVEGITAAFNRAVCCAARRNGSLENAGRLPASTYRNCTPLYHVIPVPHVKSHFALWNS